MEIHTPGSLKLPSSVLTIGAFDGVHRGHQALILKTKEQAEAHGVPCVVYTFDPPPKVHFKKGQWITSLDEKLNRLKALGVDHVIVGQFNEAFMNKTGSDFIEELQFIHPVEIWEGPCFQFGKGRMGTIEDLKTHFHVGVLQPLQCEQGEIISSTRIRSLLKQGNFSLAKSLLGDIRYISYLEERNFVGTAWKVN
ncbi:adenylyltransferase/cytidyltransferase family protein [Neobacillus drentensis]|uniref:adenylyltransferase/cytidyltransferase family protein n=1 Tax=Neobacillus drentensis TaxID=220684 RepID=UPI00300311E7